MNRQEVGKNISDLLNKGDIHGFSFGEDGSHVIVESSKTKLSPQCYTPCHGGPGPCICYSRPGVYEARK